MTPRQFSIIDMSPIFVTCAVCGAECLSTHGIPVDSETAQIVDNEFVGEWGAVASCKECHDRHATGEFSGDYSKF